ncbi:MAG: LysR substrate-binding domain-containing protein [Lysobacteraceae bacterium]
MTLTELRCFLAIVDAGLNISAAAEVMHTSQPCVSRHLKQLETSLGFKLFARHGRQLVDVTPAGRRALDSARRIINEVESLQAYAANERGDASGEFHITSPETYARHVLPPLLARLLEHYPDLSVRLHPVGEGEPNASSRNRSDLVLLTTAGDRVPDGNAVPLFRWRRVVLVRLDHVLADHQGPVPLSEVAQHPLVTYEASRRAGSTLLEAFEGLGLEPRFACSAEDAGLIKAYVRAGLGVGLVAELAISASDREEFAVLPSDDSLAECTAWAILPEGRVLRDPAVTLIRLLAPHLDAKDIRRAAEGNLPERWAAPEVYEPG